MINHTNLPQLLGDSYIEGARYCMVEAGGSGRAGRFPSPRTATTRRGKLNLEPPGTWKSLGEFADPEIASTRRFIIYQWVPTPTPTLPDIGKEF